MQRQGIALDEAVHIHATPLHQVLTERDVFGMLSQFHYEFPFLRLRASIIGVVRGRWHCVRHSGKTQKSKKVSYSTQKGKRKKEKLALQCLGPWACMWTFSDVLAQQDSFWLLWAAAQSVLYTTLLAPKKKGIQIIIVLILTSHWVV